MQSSKSEVGYPYEYIEMKFCERFGMTPFEVRAMPSKLFKKWVQMISIEASVQKSKDSNNND